MTGDWKFIGFENQQFPYELDIDKLYQFPPFQLEDEKDLGQLFTEQLNQAEEIANKLQEPTEFMTYDKKLEELMIFYVPKRK
jgi:hypothetical protein